MLPLHSPILGGHACSCGAADCSSIGKHPRTAHGLKDATTDPATINQWWAQWPSANVGLLMGGTRRLVALDIDGPEGESALAELIAHDGHGQPLPDRLTIKTGKGRHLLFVVREGVTVKPKVAFGEQLDIRGEGSYVVGPKSLHATAMFYQIVNEVKVGALPEWLTKLLTTRRPTKAKTPTTVTTDPVTDTTAVVAPVPASNVDGLEIGQTVGGIFVRETDGRIAQESRSDTLTRKAGGYRASGDNALPGG